MTFNKQSITLLLSEFERHNISKHILCPSAISLFHSIGYHVSQATEILDERSAGYVATGMSEESGEPVVLWCANNDSYRNLFSALTEAYYRKLPILVIAISRGSNINQTINPSDTIRYYVNNISSCNNEVDNGIAKAIDYLSADVKGPVFFSISVPLAETPLEIRSRKEKFHQIDITELVNLVPSEACVHIGPDFKYNCDNFKEVICREDHCATDGNLSMLIGSSLISKNQLHIGIFSHSELEYDLNMLGNRHVGNNLEIIAINQNGRSKAIYTFAKKMAWECTRVNFQQLYTIKDSLIIGETPRYIEVSI